MTREYTGFPIANFRTGFDEALEPWLLPRDAFQVLNNAHLYRGVVEKIPGYNLFTKMSYRSEIAMTGLINGTRKTFTTTLASVPTTKETVIQAAINAGATVREVFTDNGDGVLTGSNGGSGTINYVANSPVPGQPAGYVEVEFNTAPTDQTVGGIQYNSVILAYDHIPGAARPIMGIQQFIQNNGSQDVLVFDTRRVGKIVALSGSMATLQQLDYGIEELPHEVQTLNITTGFNNTHGPFTGTVNTFLVPGEVTFQVFDSSSPTAALLDTITDNKSGKLVGTTLDATKDNRINYATGEWVMEFSSNQPNTNQVRFNGCVYGDTFTGDFKNFFVTTGGQSNIGTTSVSNATFITNGVDPPRYYDGNCVLFLNTNLTVKPNTVAPYDITKCLHVVLQRERLLLLAPTFGSTPAFNSVAWSAVQNPFLFSNDDVLFAATNEPIKTFSIINSDLVVHFSNSQRVFRYTNDAFLPFRWDPTNVVWRCDGPYSAINYDSWFSSVGAPAIVGSDGVNVKRADEIIPDFTLNSRIDEQQPVPSIDQGSIGQCYGQRFDDFKEGWMCFKAFDDDSIAGVKPSDHVLAFNYLDSTYAVYSFPFSCLGFGRIIALDTWGNNFDLWQEADYTWDSFSQTEGALIDLAGDQNGKVYELGVGNSITDMDGNVIPCLLDIITKDFNPFVEQGELARFGYVDFLMSSNDNTTVRVQFYKDNQLDANFDTFYQETSIVLTANTQTKVWKRIYVGAVGREHTMRIYQNAADFVTGKANQPVRIHAIVPYFKAAGRIFG